MADDGRSAGSAGSGEGASPVRRRRRPQQRALDTRQAVIDAALTVFADRGFEAASLRAIRELAQAPQALVLYHFKSKEELWRAVATSIFAEIEAGWGDDSEEPAIARIRREFRLLFVSTLERPRLHHFMLRENTPGSPRLAWMVEHHLRPFLQRMLPALAAAQATGDLPSGDPVLLYYFLIGTTTALSTLGPEMEAATGRPNGDPAVAEAYWAMLERALFGRDPEGAAVAGTPDAWERARPVPS